MQYSTALALVIRVTIALATRTFFQPDEYFQGLEPAHFFVFGYGDLTWEWTSKPPIRSIIYPALNIPIYWLLKVFRLDGTSLLVRCHFSARQSIDSRGKDCCAESFTWPDGCWDRYMGSGAFTEDAWPELCACYCKCGPPAPRYILYGMFSSSFSLRRPFFTHYPCLVRCPTPWKRHSQLSR
jgi:Alg9-like mannosyltransferase family